MLCWCVLWGEEDLGSARFDCWCVGVCCVVGRRGFWSGLKQWCVGLGCEGKGLRSGSGLGWTGYCLGALGAGLDGMDSQSTRQADRPPRDQRNIFIDNPSCVQSMDSFHQRHTKASLTDGTTDGRTTHHTHTHIYIYICILYMHTDPALAAAAPPCPRLRRRGACHRRAPLSPAVFVVQAKEEEGWCVCLCEC